MNFAWNNPTTGLREQTDKSESLERMLAEAKYRVWSELQEVVNPPAAGADILWVVYRQEPIGTITVDCPDIDVVKVGGLPEFDFAWTNPETGIRMVSDRLPLEEVTLQLRGFQARRDSINEVVIYATWEECIVKRSDPMPEPYAFSRFDESGTDVNGDRRAGDSPDIDKQRKELEEVIALDDATKVAKVTAWALLDIASILRESSWELRAPRVRTHRNPRRRAYRRHSSLWGYIRQALRRWWRGVTECLEDSVPMPADPTVYHGAYYPPSTDESESGGTPRSEEKEPLAAAPPPRDWKRKMPFEREVTEEEQAAKRAQKVSERGPAPVEPTQPHVFTWGSTDKCLKCGKVESDAIHGYTGY